MLTRSCLIIAALALCCTAAGAQQPFYAGKQLTILVNYDAGGPTDLEARVLSRHIGRHIAGNPRIIVQNMGGAGGIVGTKYLGEVAPRDGTMLGYFTGSTPALCQPLPSASASISALTNSSRCCRAAASISCAPTSVPASRTPPTSSRPRTSWSAGCGRDGPKDMAMRLTLDMLGARYNYVTGYNSSAQAMIALQRGEISYYADSPPLYKTKIEPQVKAGTLIPVFYDPNFDGKDFSRTPTYMKDYAILPVPRALQIDQRHDAERASFGSCISPSCWSTAPCTGCSRCRPAPRATRSMRCATRS